MVEAGKPEQISQFKNSPGQGVLTPQGAQQGVPYKSAAPTPNKSVK